MREIGRRRSGRTLDPFGGIGRCILARGMAPLVPGEHVAAAKRLFAARGVAGVDARRLVGAVRLVRRLNVTLEMLCAGVSLAAVGAGEAHPAIKGKCAAARIEAVGWFGSDVPARLWAVERVLVKGSSSSVPLLALS